MILRAYAKINLTLDILGKREDGYHILDSVFQSVGVFDTVKAEKADEISVLCAGLGGKDNIAFKAAKEFFCFSGIRGGVKITINKAIPVCAGLGGGSADAAAVILALDKIYGTNYEKNQLSEIALSCGADVPFFIYGGTARVGGIGEKVEPLKDIKDCCAVILKEGEKKSTADMFKRIDSMPDTAKKTGEFLNLLKEKGGAEAFKISANAFSPLCQDKRLIKALFSQKPLCVSVSGSGPSHFAVFSDINTAQAAVKDLKALGFDPILAPFEDCGVRIIE